tara:strand:+ start:78 stop:284 length:207 start_codon:yes stop_codon:yes gene_type:complete
MNQGAVAGIVVGAVILVVIFSMMAGSGPSISSGGSKKDKFLKNKLGYIGLVIIILLALGLGGVVNSMM